MKVIEKTNLINLINRLYNRTHALKASDLQSLFEMYGDDYFKEPGAAPFELVRQNTRTINFLGGAYCKPPLEL